MKLLYTGRIAAWSTTEARLRALRELGHEVVALDALPYLTRGPRLAAKVQLHLLWGPNLTAYNDAIRRAFDHGRPDVVWVDSGVFVRPETLAALCAKTRAFVLHYHSDDIEHQRRWHRLYLRGIPYYDLHVTTNEANVPLLPRLGAKRVFRAEFGYDPALHHPVELSEADVARYASDVTFIGHWEPVTEALVNGLRRAGVRLRLWGGGWRRAADRDLRSVSAIFGEDYVRALAAAKVCLGIVSKWNRNQSAGRTFEIPAIGRFLLAERTPAHQGYYEPGEEADFFDGARELLEKVTFHLSHAEVRERIAAAGFARCTKSGYTHRDRVREILEQV